MSKRGSDDYKKLTTLQANDVSSAPCERWSPVINFASLLLQPHRKVAVQRISHDLQLGLAAFQRAQQISAERQRTVVEGVKLAVEEEQAEYVLLHLGSYTVRSAELKVHVGIKMNRQALPSKDKRKFCSTSFLHMSSHTKNP